MYFCKQLSQDVMPWLGDVERLPIFFYGSNSIVLSNPLTIQMTCCINAVIGKMKEFAAPTPTHHQPVQFRTAEAAAHIYRPSQGRASRVQHIDDQRREIHHSIERRRVVDAAHSGRLRACKFLNGEILHFFVSLNFCCIFVGGNVLMKEHAYACHH